MMIDLKAVRRGGLLDEIADLRAQLRRANKQIAEFENADFWNNWVYPEGATAEQIQNELHDFRVLVDNVAKVYDVITGGRISKPMTIPSAVIGVYEDIVQDTIDQAIKEANSEEVERRE